MNSSKEYTHRDSEGTRFHIMQYRDLAICGQYLVDPIEGTPGIGQKCVACGVEALRGVFTDDRG